MDYSEIVKQSEASDLAYAKWYAQQSDERKTEMIKSGYRMVAKNIENQIKQENQFASEADMIMKFIEYTQKEDYDAKTFAFIQQKMAERSEKEWQNRFKKMKKALGWSYEDMGRFMGASNGASVKASVNRKLPAFAKLAVCVFDVMQKKLRQVNY